MRRAVGLLVIAACTSAPCEPDDVAACLTCGPGQLRHAIVSHAPLAWTLEGDGTIVCLVCTRAWFMDPQGHTHTFAIPIGDHMALDAVAAGADGMLYVLANDTSPPPPDTPPAPPDFQLLAFDAARELAWQVDLGEVFEPELHAAPEGVYVATGKQAEPRTISALAAADGTTRWSVTLEGQVAPDGSGGVYVASDGYLPGPGTATANVQWLDASGVVQRTYSMSTTTYGLPGYPSEVFFHDLAVTADGGLLAVGEFNGSDLHLADRSLPAAPVGRGASTFFVASFDATGAPRWAQTFGALGLDNPSVAALDDAAIVAGHYSGGSGTLGLGVSQSSDGFVAVFDATGRHAAYQFGGPGAQGAGKPAVASDGSVWVPVGNGPSATGDGGFVVGNATLASGPISEVQGYLLDLVP